MQDRIFLRDLSVQAVIGVHERERAAPQPLLLDLDLELDLAGPGLSDRLEESVDYAAVAALVRGHVEGSAYRLVERLACAVAELVLERWPPVRAVRVAVTKPAAVAGAGRVGVEVRRTR
ncbi:MAG: dihydroneopterin aldolase [Planctomycetaceae bacterium]